jgi:hypothetical protein
MRSFFFEWDGPETTWYIAHYLAYYTSLEEWMMVSVELLVE